MSPLRGILLKVTALALFTFMAAFVKAAMDEVPVGQAVFFRAFFSIPIVMVFLAVQGKLATGLRTKRPMMHISRGIIGGASMACNFLALAMLPLPEVTVIGFVTPIVTLLLAIFLLGETVRMFRWSMLGLGLIGVSIVIWPRLSFGGPEASAVALLGVSFALAAATLRGFVQIHVRRMVKTENSAAIAFYFLITVSVGSLMTAPFGWVMPNFETFTLLVGAGLIGGVAQLLVTSSFRYAEASAMAPFDYTTILFSMVVGFFWFGDVPTSSMLIGASLVILSGILIIWRERALGLKERAEKAVQEPST